MCLLLRSELRTIRGNTDWIIMQAKSRVVGAWAVVVIQGTGRGRVRSEFRKNGEIAEMWVQMEEAGGSPCRQMFKRGTEEFVSAVCP